MTHLRLRPRAALKKQTGAAAIEFALLFVLFFGVFYAIVSYAVAMLLQQSFIHAAEEGARSAIAVNPLEFTSQGNYQAAVVPRVRNVVGNALNWLPAQAKAQVLGAGNSNVQLTWSGTNTLTVRVAYNGYSSNPLIPVLTLPGIGPVPKLPADLAGIAVINL